jgi:hypothetical protein
MVIFHSYVNVYQRVSGENFHSARFDELRLPQISAQTPGNEEIILADDEMICGACLFLASWNGAILLKITILIHFVSIHS